MDQIKNYIYSQIAARQLSKEQAKTLLMELHQHSAPVQSTNTDVAVIGVACRLPGANNKDEFWDMLKNGQSVIGSFPQSRRKDVDGLLPKDNTESPGDMYNPGGYLEEIDKFDAGFFRISSKEARFMDPIQRIFLETAWDAIEDAGVGGKKITGSRTGVYVGRDTSEGSLYSSRAKETDSTSLTGSTTSILASRLSYILDLKGPAMVIDTACSSGLVALYTACQALSQGEIDMAVIGGGSIFFMPVGSGMVSSEKGELRAFDKGADGTVWGEGFVAFVLKPFEEARKHKNSIYAVIKGSAINNDGSSNGITAPSAQAQSELLQAAWKKAGVDPKTISYIETHGTGTKLGDPIEIKGIEGAFGKYTDKKQFCGIGSVKTNIGHLVGASGLASMLKAVLSLKHKQIPPTLNFDSPNPLIDFLKGPVYINGRLSCWDAVDGPRRCGVSAFGFSGTNCHVILEEAVEESIEQNRTCDLNVFTLSAKNSDSLKGMIRNFAVFLKDNSQLHLGDTCYTVGTGRGHYNHRLAVITKSNSELVEKLERIAGKNFEEISDPKGGIFCGKHEVVFKKMDKEAWELYEEEKIKLTSEAGLKFGQDEKTVLTPDLAEELCMLYVKGADVNWESVYGSGTYRTLNLPVYCFNRKRHWVEMDAAGGTELEKAVLKEINHPLIDRLVTKTIHEAVFETDFSINTHWVLSEHLISGSSVIPGTTYVEMAVKASEEYLGKKAAGLRNIQFYTPLVCKENEAKTVQTLIGDRDGKVVFTIASTGEKQNSTKESWMVHATGEIIPEDTVPGRKYQIDSLLERLGEEEATEEQERGVMTFGQRWQNVKAVRRGDNEALITLEMVPELKEDISAYTLHPALLDNATSVAAIQVAAGGFYLPFSYGEVMLYGSIPSKCYCRIHPLLDPNKKYETFKYDVEIMDEQGNVIADIKDFTMKLVPDVHGRIRKLSGKDNLYFTTMWEPAENRLTTVRGNKETVLVFMDSVGTGNEIALNLRQIGTDLVSVTAAGRFEKLNDSEYLVGSELEDYERLFRDVKERKISSIIHLMSLGGTDSFDSLEQFNDQMENGVYSLFNLTKALLSNKNQGEIGMLIVSRYVSEVTGKEKCIMPQNAPLFGLAKVLGQEYPELKIRCLDMDDENTAQFVIDEMFLTDAPFMTAYRDGIHYEEVLDRLRMEKKDTHKAEIKSEGVYVITGGLGGLGLEIADLLSSKQQVKIIMVNRSALPPRAEWERILENGGDKKLCSRLSKILEIEKRGSEVACITSDISDIEAMSPIFEGLKRKYGKINGIIHGAGIAGDGFIVRKDRKTFEEVLKPKVYGTWVLDRLTEGWDLDFMILFSSTASILAVRGQGDYTAANCFLDSYTFEKNRRGCKTVTINWPAWKDTGMAFNHGANQDAVFKALSTGDGLFAFEDILDSGCKRVIVGELNYNEDIETALDSSIIRVSDSLASEIRSHKKTSRSTASHSEKTPVSEVRLTGRSKGDYTELERKLAVLWSNTLNIEQIDIYKSLYDMGGDSIIATQLARAIDKEYPGVAEISDIFTYSSVFEMAGYIEGKTKKKEGKAQQAGKTLPRQNGDDEELMNLLKGLKSGELSVESGLNILSERGESSDGK